MMVVFKVSTDSKDEVVSLRKIEVNESIWVVETRRCWQDLKEGGIVAQQVVVYSKERSCGPELESIYKQ